GSLRRRPALAAPPAGTLRRLRVPDPRDRPRPPLPPLGRRGGRRHRRPPPPAPRGPPLGAIAAPRREPRPAAVAPPRGLSARQQTPRREREMATFVLVHGAWHGGWCWRDVAARLRRAGHDVYAPSLTGLGERAHLARPGIALDDHVQDVVALLQMEALSDVVLVGHSYGGMVVTGAADREAARIRRLVYLDAFVPESGRCVLDYVVPERAAAMRREGEQVG